jgi:hypothetical protein
MSCHHVSSPLAVLAQQLWRYFNLKWSKSGALPEENIGWRRILLAAVQP